MKLEQFQIDARDNYVLAALWSSTDEYEHPLDDNYSVGDIDAASLETMYAECDAFIAANWEAIRATEQTAAQCGHDLWLTRNRHGVGFWDRGYPKALGDALTEAAHLEGERYLYIGDDGKVYQA